MADFTPSAQRRIANVVTSYEKQRLSSRDRNKRSLDANRASVLVLTPSNGIPARSGTTLGKATCTVQDIDKANDTFSDGTTLDVYNVSTSAVAGNAYVRAIRDRQGAFVADIDTAAGGGSFCVFKYLLNKTAKISLPKGFAYPFVFVADSFSTTNTSDFFHNGNTVQFSGLVRGIFELSFPWKADSGFYEDDAVLTTQGRQIRRHFWRFVYWITFGGASAGGAIGAGDRLVANSSPVVSTKQFDTAWATDSDNKSVGDLYQGESLVFTTTPPQQVGVQTPWFNWENSQAVLDDSLTAIDENQFNVRDNQCTLDVTLIKL